MLQNNLHAVLLKVSGGGLDPSKHVGKDLRTLLPAFERLRSRFGLDICGEGGEYESLVLDCPLFSKRIELTETRLVVDKDDPSVGYLVIAAFETISKDLTASSFSNVRPETIQGAISSPFSHEEGVRPPSRMEFSECSLHLTVGLDGLGSTGLLYPAPAPAASSDIEIYETCVAQQHHIFLLLQKLLCDVGAEMCDVCYVHLYLSDMKFFPHVNNEYSTWFGINPPSRSCIAVPLPEGIYVAMDVLCLVGSHAPIGLGRSARREVLHVQSYSEWAPMSIGPYSQATSIGNAVVLAAGQIALRPELMALLQCPDLSFESGLGNQLMELFPVDDSCCSLARHTPRFCTPSTERVVHPFPFVSMRDAVVGIPLPLLCELVLCIRNGREVLCSLNCDIRRRAAICVVYVCSSKLNSLLGISECKNKCLNNIKRATKVLIRDGVQELWENIDELLRYRGAKCTVDSDDVECTFIEDEQEDSVDDKAPVDTPVLIVEVEALPRDASIEVEFTGISEKYSLCNYKTIERRRCWKDSDFVLTSTCGGDQHLVELCWPFMMAAQGKLCGSDLNDSASTVAQNTSLLGAVLPEKGSTTAVVNCHEQCTISEASFCIGIVAAELASESGAEDKASDIIRRCFRSVLMSINRILWESHVDFAALRYIKLFISVRFYYRLLIDEVRSISRILIGTDVPIIVLPFDDGVSSVESTTSVTSVLAAQFCALNLLQVKTEMWIRGD